ncbi:hypothetical protein Taro_017144 [Colocasia esculenta]|uniref:Protein kinase domain-containing protein n=1 Tax=Colocasia esculenta TaxID=4460 RepID=A0A843UQM7_COLES|nr:hypothetical protein [Colocasia esculenta]
MLCYYSTELMGNSQNTIMLGYLHSKKFIHHDVKTENMLLDNHWTLRIGDFGVAQFMIGETGTLGYMAPEAFHISRLISNNVIHSVLDGKPYNKSCDVHSFGICLWEIYCCDMSYPDLSFAEASSAIVHQRRSPYTPKAVEKELWRQSKELQRQERGVAADQAVVADHGVALTGGAQAAAGGAAVADQGVVAT